GLLRKARAGPEPGLSRPAARRAEPSGSRAVARGVSQSGGSPRFAGSALTQLAAASGQGPPNRQGADLSLEPPAIRPRRERAVRETAASSRRGRVFRGDSERAER